MIVYSLLHGERIGVRPEVAIVVESVEYAPLHNGVLSVHLLVQVDLVHVNLELDELLEVFGREADLCDRLLLLALVVVVYCVLLNVLSLLVDDVGIELAEVVLVLVTVLLDFWQEQVRTFTRCRLPFQFRIPLILRHVIALIVFRRVLQMRFIVLQSECERLADLLRLVRVGHHDVAFGGEALDGEAGLLADELGSCIATIS